ncbi:disease resistance protein RPV1-like isoform X2 [Macadamia integrifolia]|uniref:disease resistance protein RPV1-like isoform X2 n=1 Tax=Macadamia integrifolia TaxID=60698 RepID=UPI001C4FA0C5|nr:disease resistance protein RPV1-like isoform X2 [Macadamia integrifolia]
MAAQNWASTSSSAASTVGSSSNYDVFLNFRGEDTRNNFTGFLHKILKDRGINAFIDSENLRTGEAIGQALLGAIQGSKISIPIFSKGYAYSKWCLLELAQIVQCQRSNGQMVLPIFFYVEPSHVRNQTGSFEEAFREYEKILEPHIVESWREALRVVGNLKGEVLDETKDQAELVELVVKRALSELVSSTQLAGCKYRVGMDSSVNDLLSLLDIGSKDAHFVGICGSGGIGKTTIAKAVYNHIFSSFKRHSFLSDVREQAMQYMGLVSLQKRLFKDIFKADFDIGDFHTGKKLIEERVCKEKVLLVLDDVDGNEQIDALAGGLNWFGHGSRVIITTRDEHILNVAKVNRDKIYRPQLLDQEHSLQLFSWHAFQNNQPPEDYMQLSRIVAIHSGGLPLALEVFGSYLSDLSNKEEWESTIQILKEIPPEEVQRRLKISYDNLENDYQKAIFLDAACFFIGWKKEIVISIWEACGYHPKSSICRLIKRSLLKFEDSWDGECLMMHDHIRDMGREIVLEEGRMEPGKRSRLWSYGEILEVLEGNKRFQKLKVLDLSTCVYLSKSPDFSWFPYLEQLYLGGCYLLDELDDSIGQLCQLKSLILISCEALKKLPESIGDLKSLVNLDLSDTSIKELPDSICRMSSLKELALIWCNSLKKLPESIGELKSLVKLDLGETQIEELPYNISCMSSLKELILTSCRLLKKLSESIGDLKSLVKLDLRKTQMEELPDNISKMGSLKELILTSCNSLKKLPESIGDLRSLVKLELSETQIEELPDSISRMSFLKELTLKSCNSLKKLPESIGDLKSLVKLDLTETKVEEIPDSISKMNSLKELILIFCDSFKKLPESIGDLKSLVKLDLTKTQIEELPDNISRMSSLEVLILKRCISLKKLPIGVGLLEKLEVLDAEDCTKLVKLPRSMGRMRRLHSINLTWTNISKFPDDFLMLSNLVNLEINHLRSLQSLPIDMSPVKTLKKLMICQCKKLKYILMLPSSLVELCCEKCVSLVRRPDLSKLKNLTTLNLRYCKKLEEIPGLEGTESLKELSAQGCYNLTRTPRQIQGTLLPNDRELSYSYSLTANNGIYNNGFILCLVLEFFSTIDYNLKVKEGHILRTNIEICACIHQKDKKMKCFHTLRIKDLEYTTDRDVIYIHHFKGFDWFGIPLQEKDVIEILYIRTYRFKLKFWEILFKNREPDQQKPNSSSVADFFNWSYVDDDGGAVTLNYWPNQQWRRRSTISHFFSRVGFDPVSEGLYY